TYSQEMVWFLGQLAPENLAYNTQFQLRLTGKLDVDGLRRALTELVRRHESLRTTFPAVGGRPVQQIAEPFDVELELVDLAELEVQLADFAAWQRAWVESGALDGQIEFWRRTLVGRSAEELRLPSDRPRPEVPRFRGATEPLPLPAEQCAALAEVGQHSGATL